MGLRQQRNRIYIDGLGNVVYGKRKSRVNMLTGGKTSKISAKASKSLENTGRSGKIESKDIVIHKSLGAKSKNYDIELPNREIVNLTEGTRITNIKVIAGKGRNRQIDEIDLLIEKWGGNEAEWQKKKGIGFIDYNGESYKVELHWYEEPTAGRHKWKVKPDADGNWFLEDE